MLCWQGPRYCEGLNIALLFCLNKFALLCLRRYDTSHHDQSFKSDSLVSMYATSSVNYRDCI